MLPEQITFSLISECPVLSVSEDLFHGKCNVSKSVWYSYKGIKGQMVQGGRYIHIYSRKFRKLGLWVTVLWGCIYVKL